MDFIEWMNQPLTFTSGWGFLFYMIADCTLACWVSQMIRNHYEGR